MAVLHITNGDCAAEVLRAAGMAGDILPWRDVLHEGPVRSDLPLEELSALRARFIADAGWGAHEAVAAQFAERDALLRGSTAREEVVLWFEHDLYDQLQLIQLLAWFAVHPRPRLALVCEAEYIGTMTPARAAELFQARKPVRRRDLQAGLSAWAAFGASDHRQLEAMLERPFPLRFLRAALRRLLQEYPWTSDGLSRLEREALAPLRLAPCGLRSLFEKVQVQENPAFLGDSVLEWHLRRLEREGLVKGGAEWRLTERGDEVLSGRRDAWKDPRAPRWLGGVQVSDGRPRWDPAAVRLVSA